MPSFHTYRISLAALSLTALSLGGFSCGDDAGPGTGEQPGIAPGAPDRAHWTEVSRRFVCSGECVPGTLVVTREGEYYWIGQSRKGRLSGSEQQELEQAVRGVLEEIDTAQQAEPLCSGVAGTETATERVTLKRGDRPLIVVFEYFEASHRKCVQGNETKVETLRASLAALMEKYGIRAMPGVPGTYDPCAGKSCGERCTLCDPRDSECVETAVLKFCSRSGECQMQDPLCAGL